MLRRFTATLLVILSLNFLSIQQAQAVRFADTTDNWAEHYITFLADSNIANLPIDGHFNPSEHLTRETLATWLIRAARLENEPLKTRTNLADVSQTDPQYKEIALALQNGFMTLDGNSFHPQQKVSKLELIETLAKAAKLKPLTDSAADAELSKYTDASQFSGSNKVAIAALSTEGLLPVKPGATALSLNSPALRDEASLSIYMLRENIDLYYIAQGPNSKRYLAQRETIAQAPAKEEPSTAVDTTMPNTSAPDITADEDTGDTEISSDTNTSTEAPAVSQAQTQARTEPQYPTIEEAVKAAARNSAPPIAQPQVTGMSAPQYNPPAFRPYSPPTYRPPAYTPPTYRPAPYTPPVSTAYSAQPAPAPNSPIYPQQPQYQQSPLRTAYAAPRALPNPDYSSYSQTGQYQTPATQADSSGLYRGHLVIVGAGTPFTAKLTNGINTATATAGETVLAVLNNPIYVNGVVVIPAGAQISGTITQVTPAKNFQAGAGGKIEMVFNKLTAADGRIIPLQASVQETDFNLSGAGRAARIRKGLTITATGAAAGALLGTALGGVVAGSPDIRNGPAIGKGAIYGTAIGAGIGALVALTKKGDELLVPSGTVIPLMLDEPLRINGMIANR